MSALLLLHGFTGGPECWDEVCARLPEGVTVLRPELGGHGATPSRPWDDEVARLEQLLVGHRGVHVVGYSMGGRLGWTLLARDRGRIARATLIGAHPGLDDAAERAARRDADQRWIELLEREGVDAFADAWERLPLWASQARLPAERRGPRAATRRRHRAEGLASALRHLGLAAMPPLEPARVRVPVHLVVGGADERHRAIAEALRPRLPVARLSVVEGAGHDPTLERPDVVAALVSEPPALPTMGAAR